MDSARQGGLGDFNEVQEIRALKRKPMADEAQRMLEQIARQVRPIMQKRGWRVMTLSEFCPSNKALLGVNVNRGREIRIRLRRPNNDLAFFPYEALLGTMLHELAHMARGPHDAQFYAVLDELTKECEDLMAKGITGEASSINVFSGKGRTLGGYSLPLSGTGPGTVAAAAAAAAAAERRSKQAVVPRQGGQRLGGDRGLMRALSPAQAAAMAAERRLRDNMWCGEEWEGGEAQGQDDDASPMVSSGHDCRSGAGDAALHHLGAASQAGKRRRLDISSAWKRGELVGERSVLREPKASAAATQNSAAHQHSAATHRHGHHATNVGADSCGLQRWSCRECTFLNLEVPQCEMCGSPRVDSATRTPELAPDEGRSAADQVTAQDGSLRKEGGSTLRGMWTCGLCTLENESCRERCGACDTWRYHQELPRPCS